MKLFKVKRSHRSNEPTAQQQPPPSPASSAAETSSSAQAAVGGEGGGGGGEDFMLQEEEYQIQLAMALSASASSGECAGDPDGEQIRKAKLISLGRGDPAGGGGRDGGDTAESLSRCYRDYNFLDYNEKVIDGFYDIFGLSTESSRQGNIPSLAELQMGIGDPRFEVIVINHEFDRALREMEEVAQCYRLGCSDIVVLVRQIAELVTENMGGPVKDANEMFTRWLDKSFEQRTSLQTSLLPIGNIEIGLSRHRALLFKILADSVDIPCKLVKGSHYTGVDDDAINIIQMDNEREFLVDLMAAPGTLIPADVINSKGTSLNSNRRVSQNHIIGSTSSIDNDPSANALLLEHKGNKLSMLSNGNWISDNQSGNEKTTTASSSQNPWASTSSVTAGSSVSESLTVVPHVQSDQPSTSAGTSSKQKDVLPNGEHLWNGDLKLIPDSEETEVSKNLFAELNPFGAIESGKMSVPFKGLDGRNNELQRRRENVAPGPGRPQQPLVVKNWSAYNDISKNKQYNFVEGLVPRRNVGDNVASSQVAWSAAKNSNPNVGERNDRSYAAPVRNYDNKMLGTAAMNTISTSGECNDDRSYGASVCYYDNKMSGTSAINTASNSGTGKVSEKGAPDDLHNGPVNSRLEGQLRNIVQGMVPEAKGNKENYGKHEHRKLPPDPKKSPLDRFMDTRPNRESVSSLQVRLSRLDTVLDDVSECEILWEDLVIGERIGLGSYGEVYRADWNGTEVAVKKFLDQEFYGDALDEFRSEVRIMRRLRHPNVVLFMGAVTRPPNLSIVSEYLPRGSLYKILHRPNCQIDENRRIKMALDVAKGMNCLHTSAPTIVHRDLKSPNLLVDNNWRVKVCDFGLSRLKHSTFLSSKSTAGTPEWMAPEVLRNEQSNEKCDVYSFGVILWELATLRMPWHGMNPMQVVGAVGFQDRRLDIPKEVDPIVARIIWECWQKDPNLRPSFAQLTSYLEPLQRLVIPSHQGTQSPPVPQEISVNSTP